MGNGSELVLQLALRQKPTAFSIHGNISNEEVITNAINAVRLFGHSQILVGSGYRWGLRAGGPDGDAERPLAKICEMIAAMQVKGEKIDVTTTPDKPEERAKTGFCRIDLHLKK